MSEIYYCPKCQRNVDVSIWDTTSIIILIVLLLIGLLPGLIYLVYKLAKTKRCSYCGTLVNDMEPPRYDTRGPSMRPIASSSSVGKAYCSKCGAENSSDAVYCNACGAKIKE